jgi:heat shock protein HtpX
MWEQIRANKRKSTVLVFAMAALLMILGFAIGGALLPTSMTINGEQTTSIIPGGLLGAFAAGFVWLVMTTVAYFSGGKILMAASGAHRIEKEDHPQLFNVVEEMTIASGMGKMPEVYIIDDPAPNAFATGRDTKHCAVAVTAGLLTRLNRDQLQGVIAHEIGHIINRDVLFMQMLGVMVGSIVLISDVFLRGMFYGAVMGGRRRSRNSSSGGGNAQAIMMVVAVVMAILSPILAQVIYMAASRRREYLADAQSAVLTRYPEGLASALAVISNDSQQLAKVSRATAPMYICNPMKKAGLAAASMMRTHPPTEERIKVLRGMAGAASYAEYARASESIGVGAALPASALAAGAGDPIRNADARAGKTATPKQHKAQMRQVGDALRNASNFAFLPCACGLRIKLPPKFKKDKVQCPKCNRILSVPIAALATAGVLANTLSGEGPIPGVPPVVPASAAQTSQQLTIRHTAGQWMSFKCSCGNAINLAPTFSRDAINCKKCGKGIAVQTTR